MLGHRHLVVDAESRFLLRPSQTVASCTIGSPTDACRSARNVLTLLFMIGICQAAANSPRAVLAHLCLQEAWGF